MSDRKRNRTYWMIVLGSTVLTVVALFGMQEWHRTYMLLSTGGPTAEVGAEVEALKRSHREELATGRMPIDRAMRLMVERGRTASALVIPESSTDPGPASGWLHHPDYEGPPQAIEEPQEPQAIEEPQEAQEPQEPQDAEPAEPVEAGEGPEEGAAEGAPSGAEPAEDTAARPQPEAAQ